jgi:hypothetical protein
VRRERRRPSLQLRVDAADEDSLDGSSLASATPTVSVGFQGFDDLNAYI